MLVLLLLIDRLPLWRILFSMASHLVYFMNMAQFPFIPLVSFTSILSITLVFANHFIWFHYFRNSAQEYFASNPGSVFSRYDDYSYTIDEPFTFSQTAAFFLICVWLVPCILFIAFGTNDISLPIMEVNPEHRKNSSDNPFSALPVQRRRNNVIRKLNKHLHERFEGVLAKLGWDERGLAKNPTFR